ncbi:hypothetical protein KTJ34_07250 [Acinetobacter courvalinii]|nr:hypothetical protein [Acinetobacter courvalinii]
MLKPIIGCSVLLVSTSYASTFYQLTVPTKPLPYCEFMPFDYVEQNIIKTELFNRITVKEPVTISFKRRWWDFKPLTGMTLWSSKGKIQTIQKSAREYQYRLPASKKGEVYELRGMLKFPAKSGLQICVSALSR